MAKLLYIISSGHSGSTLLDILAGTINGVFASGELKRFSWQMAKRYKNEESVENLNVCSCLQPFAKCSVWQKVANNIHKTQNINVFKEPDNYDIAMLDIAAHGKKMNFGIRIPRYLFFSMLTSGIKTGSLLFNAVLKQSLNKNWKLLDSIAQTTNSLVVTDSSKSINRFVYLNSFRPENTYVILNTRDPLGYAYSYIKRGVPPEQSLKMRQLYLEQATSVLRKLKKSYISISYEELCANPVSTRIKIAQYLNISEPGKFSEIDTHDMHLIAGNPMRYNGKISIKQDESWRQKLSNHEIEAINKLVKKYSFEEAHEEPY